jgi:hypothetical protein
MSFRYTLDVRGVRHGVERQIGTRREPIHDDDPSSTRSYPACGGYVDAKPDAGFLVVTCVRCLGIDLLRRLCIWCKPPGSRVDTCEADGRCVSCWGTGIADDEGET